MSSDPHDLLAAPYASSDDAAAASFRPPILEYARPVPEFSASPLVEEAIVARRSMQHVASFFRDGSAAAEYVRCSLMSRFDAVRAGDVCAACGAAARERLVATWRFEVPALAMRFYVTGGPVHARATTAHAFCTDCSLALRRRNDAAKRTARVCWLAIPVGLGLAVLGAFAASNVPASGLVVLGVGVVLLFVGVLGVPINRVVAQRLAVPARLRRVLPRWLRFDSWGPAVSR